MGKLNIKKISIILIVLIIGGVFASYNYINSNNYNKLITAPNNCTKDSDENNSNNTTKKYTNNEPKEDKKTSEKNVTNMHSKTLNIRDAENVVRKLVLSNSSKTTKVQFDHEQTVDGVKYLVIHVYDLIKDNENTSHSATKGWYYVNPTNSKVFDGTLGNLDPLN